MLKRKNDPDQYLERLDRIEVQLWAIDTLVDSLTLMAKLDSGLHMYSDQKININNLLELAQVQSQAIIAQKKLTLNVQFLESPVLISGDFEYLKIALHNLIDNVVMFTDEGGVIELSASENDDTIQITVQDTGSGISADILPLIFERFYRSDKAGTTRGFGLGLPIAKAIAEQHGGTITVDSTVAQGSAFHLILPSDNQQS